MEIYNGTRETGIKERPLPEAVETPDREETVLPPEPAPAAEPPLQTPVPQTELFQGTEAPRTVPEDNGRRDDSPDSDPSFSRYATPIRTSEAAALPSLWRIGTLALAGLAILLALVLGIRALYHATSDAPLRSSDSPAALAAPEPAAAKAPPAGDKEKNASRVQQKIPSLYID